MAGPVCLISLHKNESQETLPRVVGACLAHTKVRLVHMLRCPCRCLGHGPSVTILVAVHIAPSPFGCSATTFLVHIMPSPLGCSATTCLVHIVPSPLGRSATTCLVDIVPSPLGCSALSALMFVKAKLPYRCHL